MAGPPLVPSTPPLIVPTMHNKVAGAMHHLATYYNEDATNFLSGPMPPTTQPMSRTSSPEPSVSPAGGQSGQTAINWKNFTSFVSIACLTMLDRLQLSPDELAMTSITPIDPTTLKPEQYKDFFTVPANFNEPWNHSCPFQRQQWRDAVHTEFAKIAEKKVWRKEKKIKIHKGRRNANGSLI